MPRVTIWATLSPDERRMLHQVYDHPPWTPWTTVFLRYQAAYMTEEVRALWKGGPLYGKYKIPPEDRERICERLKAALIRRKLVYGDDDQEKNGKWRGEEESFKPSDGNCGPLARLTDRGWTTLGCPGPNGFRPDFESDKRPEC